MCRQKRALLFETAKNRHLVDSDLLRRFTGATISCLPGVPLTVDNLLFWRNFGLKSPDNLQELLSDQPSTDLYTSDAVHKCTCSARADVQ